MGIEIKFRRGLQDDAETIVSDSRTIATLLKQGFVRDTENLVLYLPIHIPAEKLAQGFEQNDLTPVVEPFGQAMAQALAAKPALDKLLEQVRTAAKHK
jgi:hypothetical protein